MSWAGDTPEDVADRGTICDLPGSSEWEREPAREAEGSREAARQPPTDGGAAHGQPSRSRKGTQHPTEAMTPSVGRGTPARHGSGTDTGGRVVVRSPVRLAPKEVVFEKYRVVERLGRGGMGEVWLVEHVELGLPYALKTMTNFSEEALVRFRREARVLARLKHDNIVRVFDSQLDSKAVAYILMEHVAGESLHQVFEEHGRMPLGWVAEILAQLAGALQEAHDAGIIHRDLKPSNLMLVEGVDGRRRLKVLDFGIAKVLPKNEDMSTEEGSTLVPEEHRTAAGSFIGTPHYASPEQCVGAAERRSDLYSAGVILYQFLTGRLPFVGPQHVVMLQIMNVAPPTFAEVAPDHAIPAAVERVVMRCLAKKPEDRPESATALLAEFRAAIVADAIPGTGGGTATIPWHRRKAIQLAGAGAGLLLAVAATAAIVRTPKPVPVEEKPGAATTTDPAVATPIPTPTKAPAGLAATVVVDGRPFVLDRGKVYLPRGYEAVSEAGLAEDGYPRMIARDDSRLVRIEGGRYRLGMKARDPRPGDELPGFYIGEHEVTNGELTAHVEAHGDPDTDTGAEETWSTLYARARADAVPEADRLPARRVPWKLAAAYAKDRGGRLPSEVQWEYAARSRDASRVTVWDDPAGPTPINDLANIFFQFDGRPGPTIPVGRYKETDRTRQGVLDMAGNVREWCRDARVLDRDNKTLAVLPIDAPAEGAGPDTAASIRGGSFNVDPEFKDVTRRHDPVRLSAVVPPDAGFRIVVECPTVPTGR